MSARAPEHAQTATADGVYLPVDETARADVTVLMGGPSREREVSFMSGEAVAAALGRCGHHVTTADISPQDTADQHQIHERRSHYHERHDHCQGHHRHKN